MNCARHSSPSAASAAGPPLAGATGVVRELDKRGAVIGVMPEGALSRPLLRHWQSEIRVTAREARRSPAGRRHHGDQLQGRSDCSRPGEADRETRIPGVSWTVTGTTLPSPPTSASRTRREDPVLDSSLPAVVSPDRSELGRMTSPSRSGLPVRRSVVSRWSGRAAGATPRSRFGEHELLYSIWPQCDDDVPELPDLRVP
jgi:hypothetical protein